MTYEYTVKVVLTTADGTPWGCQGCVSSSFQVPGYTVSRPEVRGTGKDPVFARKQEIQLRRAPGEAGNPGLAAGTATAAGFLHQSYECGIHCSPDPARATQSEHI